MKLKLCNFFLSLFLLFSLLEVTKAVDQNEEMDSTKIVEIARTNARQDFAPVELGYTLKTGCLTAPFGLLSFNIGLISSEVVYNLFGIDNVGALFITIVVTGSISMTISKFILMKLKKRIPPTKIPDKRIQELHQAGISSKLIVHYRQAYLNESEILQKTSLKLGSYCGYTYAIMSILFWSYLLLELAYAVR